MMVVLPPCSASVRVYQRPAMRMFWEYGVEPVMIVGLMLRISMKRLTALALSQSAVSAMLSEVLAKVISVTISRALRAQPSVPKRPLGVEPFANCFLSIVFVVVWG